jgi:fibronectin-binding autotransporter adhesin
MHLTRGDPASEEEEQVMRSIKSFGILAAAIAAVPGIALAAGEGEVYVPQVLTHQPDVQLPGDTLIGDQSGRFRYAPAGPVFTGGAEADVDATWVGTGFSWLTGANWSTDPQIPDGPNAIARFSQGSGGGTVSLGSAVTLSRLDMNDPQYKSVYGGGGGTLNFAGAGQIHANGSNFDFPSTIFTFTVGGGGNVIGGTGTLLTTIGGTAGLNKTGDTHVQLSNANTFSGPINISGGGKIITTVGDDAFGNASNPITLNNGSIQISTANMTANRVITAGPGGGTIHYVGAGRTFDLAAGDIAGSGTMTFNGAFGANASTAGTISVNTSHTGTLNVAGGTLNLGGANGAFRNSSHVLVAGAMNLRAGNNDRIGNSAAVIMQGGQMTVYNQEALGNVTFDGSTQIIALTSGSSLSMNSLTRNNMATARFLGQNLGEGGSTITFGAAPTLVGGLIPWAYGSSSDILFTNPESQTNTVVTYGPNGVQPVNTLESNQANWNSSVNALIDDAGANITGTRNVNSLVLRVSDFYQSDPMRVTGNGTINVASGVVLSGNAGFTSGGAINSGPGNIVDANLNAGSNTFYIHTPSAVELNGVLSGSGGLVKTGGRTAAFNGANTYTGETQLTGFVRFTGNVLSGQPSPFGADTSPIVLYSGNIVPRNLADQSANGTMSAILALDDTQTVPSTFSRPLNAASGSVLIRNFAESGGTLTMNGNIAIGEAARVSFQGFGPAAGETNSNSFVINGVMSGPGRVEYSGIGTALVHAALNGQNTYTGGTAASGNLYVGANSVGTPGNITSGPFGTGSIQMSAAGTFLASGGPRVILNPLNSYSGNVTLGDGIDLAGEVRFLSSNRVVDVPSGTAKISGGIGSGAGIFKQGVGTLVIGGNSTYDGVLNIGNGATPGGVVVIDSDTATGSTTTNSGVNADLSGGGNVMLLRGGRTIGDERMFIRGNGIGSMGALHAESGNNTWGGRVSLSAQYANAGSASVSVLSQQMSIGADAGATLSITRSISTLDSGASNGGTTVFLAPAIGMNKVGGGLVNVGSDAFVATRSSGGTSTFEASVLTSGSLNVAAGTLRMLPGVGATRSVADVASVAIGAGAKLDLTNNAMVVDYDGPSQLGNIRTLIVQGYNGGAWNGSGIMSSMADASNFGLGYAEASGVLSYSGTPADALFLGNVVDESAVLVRHTRYGDADLNGVVNLSDFNRLAANFGSVSAVWSQGDFNYDGLVNLADFNRLAANFGLQAAGPDVSPEDWSNLASAIPEPSSLAFAAVGALALVRRRRR